MLERVYGALSPGLSFLLVGYIMVVFLVIWCLVVFGTPAR